MSKGVYTKTVARKQAGSNLWNMAEGFGCIGYVTPAQGGPVSFWGKSRRIMILGFP